jgi:hypothetical protein
MDTALLGIGTAVAATLIGWLGEPADAVLFGFFGLWGVLMVWSAGRTRADDDHESDLSVRM